MAFSNNLISVQAAKVLWFYSFHSLIILNGFWIKCKYIFGNSLNLSVKSPSLSTPYPLFHSYPQSNEILLNLSIKYWNSSFNGQGSRVIVAIVEVGAVKIYVAPLEALKKKERGGCNWVYHQNWWKN